MPSKIVLATISSPNYFPVQLALYYLKAYFLKHGNHRYLTPESDIKISIFKAEDKEKEIAKDIIKEKPRIIGFSCYLWNIKKILRIAEEIKKEDPSIKIVLGGPEVSPRIESILKKEKQIDIIVRGEGEETFFELIEGLLYHRRKLSRIKGISYRRRGRIFKSKPRPHLDDLDSIPSPYLEGLIDLEYDDRSAYVATETMRGCPYRCRYCYYHKEFNKVRYFSLGRVEKELKWILARRPAIVYLMDPTFNVDRERAKKILRIFIKHNKNSRLHLELRAEKLDKETAELLAQAGIAKLEIGIQSIFPEVLKNINRDLDKKNFAKKIRLLNRKKIFSEVSIIDALPGHTYDRIKKGVDWLISLRSPCIKIMKLSVIPGTYLRDNAGALGIRYSSEPYYFWRRTDTLSPEDRNRIDRLLAALATLYNEGFLRNTLFTLKKGLGVNFTDILEAWADWRSQLRIAGKKAKNGPLDFIEYLCDRYKNAGLREKAYRVFLERDLKVEKFLKRKVAV